MGTHLATLIHPVLKKLFWSLEFSVLQPVLRASMWCHIAAADLITTPLTLPHLLGELMEYTNPAKKCKERGGVSVVVEPLQK